jgi:hypothetical protein
MLELAAAFIGAVSLFFSFVHYKMQNSNKSTNSKVNQDYEFKD